MDNESEIISLQTLLGEFDEKNINQLIIKWREVEKIKKQINDLDDLLKLKIKAYLKERLWDRYLDKETKISVTLSSQKTTSIDREQLTQLLTEEQLAKVTKTTTFEKLLIVTPEAKARMKNYVTNKKANQ